MEVVSGEDKFLGIEIENARFKEIADESFYCGQCVAVGKFFTVVRNLL